MTKEIALSKCMAMCSKKEYCIYDIKQKLIKWEVAEVDEVIDRLIEERFLDEERYVPAYVRDKFRFNQWGKIKIRYSLKQKQIPEYLIKQELEKINAEEYRETGMALLRKKHRQIPNDDPYQAKSKMVRFLASRGFEPNLIYEWAEIIINCEL